jgi:ketosteroid isomerase-like protein
MTDIWSHAAEVTNMGPFSGRKVGWEKLGSQFAWEARQKLGAKVDSQDLLVLVSGNLGFAVFRNKRENLALEGNPIQARHRATNIFRRESGQWNMVHHLTDPPL